MFRGCMLKPGSGHGVSIHKHVRVILNYTTEKITLYIDLINNQDIILAIRILVICTIIQIQIFLAQGNEIQPFH